LSQFANTLVPERFIVGMANRARRDLAATKDRSVREFGYDDHYPRLVTQAINDLSVDPMGPGSLESSQSGATIWRVYPLSFRRTPMPVPKRPSADVEGAP
jgi:hypothetical protein